MAKFAGLVGYALEKETSPGVWTNEVVERKMRGDVIRLSSSFRADGRRNIDKVHDDVSLDHRISLVADPFAYENFTCIKYINYLGQKWKVESIEVQRPRLILSVGGLWNV